MIGCEQERPRLRSVPASVGTLGRREKQKRPSSQFWDAYLLHLELNVHSAQWRGGSCRSLWIICYSEVRSSPLTHRKLCSVYQSGFTRNTIRKEGVSFAAPPISGTREIAVNICTAEMRRRVVAAEQQRPKSMKKRAQNCLLLLILWIYFQM